MFQGCFKEVLRCYKKDFEVLQGSFKQGCCKKVSRVFEGRLRGVSMEFEVGFKFNEIEGLCKVSTVFQ